METMEIVAVVLGSIGGIVLLGFLLFLKNRSKVNIPEKKNVIRRYSRAGQSSPRKLSDAADSFISDTSSYNQDNNSRELSPSAKTFINTDYQDYQIPSSEEDISHETGTYRDPNMQELGSLLRDQGAPF
jgi:hypothetical protein